MFSDTKDQQEEIRRQVLWHWRNVSELEHNSAFCLIFLHFYQNCDVINPFFSYVLSGTLKIEDLCPYEENKNELVNAKTLKRSDFNLGINQIEQEILEKEARAIELALEDNNTQAIPNMHENKISLKRKIHDDVSTQFNRSFKLAADELDIPSDDLYTITPKS